MTTFTKPLNKTFELNIPKKGLLLSVALSSVFALSACSNDNETSNAGSAEMNQTAQQNTMDVKQPEPVEQTKQNLVEPVALPKSEAVAEESTAKASALPEIVPKTPVVKKEAESEVVVEDKVEAVEEKVVKQVEAAKEVVASVNGQQVYATCAGCHGAQAEGGIGPKLAGQAVADIVDKLKRYKAGEQIGPLTGMMAPMAAPLSDEEMQAVAEYTASL